ncbi:P-loop NTPase family protein [Nisaea nitritireducens]|uniref:adenylate kinase n=1 Tax=Nisaea nitritireducens TaxID=568392 RepID=UPI00186708A2|nr:adenylate kinase [Nisaea nitritireducens]
MKRILIVGCPGAGKSTAARSLTKITGLPVIHLDGHYWKPGWVRPGQDEWRAKVQELANRPRWIMDGNYGGSLDLRLPVADTLIHLDFSTAVCVTRALRRAITGLGSLRGEEFDEGCPERLDWAFLRFVLNYRRGQRLPDLERLSHFRGEQHRFTAPRQLKMYLANLEASRSKE